MLKKLQHKFVKTLPENLEEGMLYISIKYRVSSHLCCCGCGEKVIIIFSPTDWVLIFDGPTISIEPSVGNWSFSCRSHYCITKNNVIRAAQWSQEQINRNRKQDIKNKERYYGKMSLWDKFLKFIKIRD